jgi:hypothetical protein
MKRAAILLFALAFSAPANAMDWCSILKIIPRKAVDLERLAPSVEPLTGCARQASDSAHWATWLCPDDPATPDVYEGVRISYFREPGKSIHMIVLASDLGSLDILRRCGVRDLRDGRRFDPGNIAFRDRVQFGALGPQLTLLSISPKGFAGIISDGETFTEAGTKMFSLWSRGITVESAPVTDVKLAGKNPISNDVETIVSAFKERGSSVKEQKDLDGPFPQWRLTPPTGLAGVTEVVIKGFSRHLQIADYILESTTDYERYIAILDSEYGKSRREVEAGCTYRWWESGDMAIRGEHCPAKSDSLRFYNSVALRQLDQVAAKLKADDAKDVNDPAMPTIDRDML